MLYWTLAGIGKPAGITVGLLAAGILGIFGAVRRNYNLMALVPLIFFGVAALVTFGLGSSLFIDNSGFLGYLALLAMVVVSLILKQPYTMQVSKRDYPEAYWRDPTFLLINNIITGIWAFIISRHPLKDYISPAPPPFPAAGLKRC